MARARTRIRGRGFKPPPDWVANQETGLTTVAVSTKVLMGTFTVTGSPETVRRVRGLVHWQSDQSAASETPFGAIGMCVVTQDAAAAGAASIPGPFTDAASSVWLYHQFLLNKFTLGSAIGFDANAGTQYEIDSKGMRRVSDEQEVAIMVENGNSTQAAQVIAMIRMLATVSYG